MKIALLLLILATACFAEAIGHPAVVGWCESGVLLSVQGSLRRVGLDGKLVEYEPGISREGGVLVQGRQIRAFGDVMGVVAPRNNAGIKYIVVDGDVSVMISDDNVVDYWGVGNGIVRSGSDRPAKAAVAAFSYERAMYVIFHDGSISLVKLNEKGELVWHETLPDQGRSEIVAFGIRGHRVFMAGERGSLLVVDMRTGGSMNVPLAVGVFIDWIVGSKDSIECYGASVAAVVPTATDLAVVPSSGLLYKIRVNIKGVPVVENTTVVSLAEYPIGTSRVGNSEIVIWPNGVTVNETE